METKMTACIVGWAHSRFGKLEGETLESLITQVANEALAHAGIGPDDVDEIVLGHFNAGFSAQDFTASLVLQADDRLRFKPATRVENACATGSAAVHPAEGEDDAHANGDEPDEDRRKARRESRHAQSTPAQRTILPPASWK